MSLDKLIRFGFASRRRKIMTLVLAGAASIAGLFGGGGGDKPAPKPAAAVQPAGTTTVDYASCGEVRAAGKAPLHRGDPGYSTKLDRDGDGVACS